jgi:hypothetical protein
MGGDVAGMAKMKNTYKILVGKLQGKRLLVRPRRRWEIMLEWILAE